ncbi:amino acid ABC transporter permease [Diaphorobacter aerolatus]|uniref:Amino acid ABC transporter permease n=1 Tax=Diaphorobacter aerolatus TaxID=1288495 RepID=A0A7H0GMU3_9BURK|nr:amino acid ABC transporter permease [Diaphorobacter aerolatus]QNP49609.1 amino acid ABC transporter permease [Diaphorobacter aerolatus]
MGDIFNIFKDNLPLLLVGQYPYGPLGGLAMTLIVSVAGIVLAFPLSVLMAMAMVSPWRALRLPVQALVAVLRGVPLIMFIFWVYFLVPLVIGSSISGATTMLVTLVFYQAAYLAEIVRAGIQGLPRGQMEASRALGMSYIQTSFKVILPQALFNMIPSMIGQFVSTIKETSLGYVISMNELTFAANQINNQLLTKPFEVYFILAAMYFLLCFTLTSFARWLEKRIANRRAGVTAATNSAETPPVASIANAD